MFTEKALEQNAVSRGALCIKTCLHNVTSPKGGSTTQQRKLVFHNTALTQHQQQEASVIFTEAK